MLLNLGQTLANAGLACIIRRPWHVLLELTLRNSKDLAQPHQKTASLIMHVLDHIKEDQRANFGSTRTIFEC